MVLFLDPTCVLLFQLLVNLIQALTQIPTEQRFLSIQSQKLVRGSVLSNLLSIYTNETGALHVVCWSNFFGILTALTVTTGNS